MNYVPDGPISKTIVFWKVPQNLPSHGLATQNSTVEALIKQQLHMYVNRSVVRFIHEMVGRLTGINHVIASLVHHVLSVDSRKKETECKKQREPFLLNLKKTVRV